jgi:hypothetical protein
VAAAATKDKPTPVKDKPTPVKDKSAPAPETNEADQIDATAEKTVVAPNRRTLVPAAKDEKLPRAHRLQEFSQLFGDLQMSLQSRLEGGTVEAEKLDDIQLKPA